MDSLENSRVGGSGGRWTSRCGAVVSSVRGRGRRSNGVHGCFLIGRFDVRSKCQRPDVLGVHTLAIGRLPWLASDRARAPGPLGQPGAIRSSVFHLQSGRPDMGPNRSPAVCPNEGRINGFPRVMTSTGPRTFAPHRDSMPGETMLTRGRTTAPGCPQPGLDDRCRGAACERVVGGQAREHCRRGSGGRVVWRGCWRGGRTAVQARARPSLARSRRPASYSLASKSAETRGSSRNS